MSRTWRIALVQSVALILAGPLLAQEVFIYPTKGQSPEQQNRDRYECHTWAVQQTGFDPARPQVAAAPPPTPSGPQGEVVRGAARGAALGAVGGAIAGDAGKGAAIGAGTGALFGGMKRMDRGRARVGRWPAVQAHLQQRRPVRSAEAAARRRLRRGLEGTGAERGRRQVHAVAAT